MKKVILAVSAVLMAFALTSCGKKTERGEFTVQKGKLMIGCEIGYPPFEYFAEDGKTPAGFDIELGKEVAKRLGLEAEVIDTAWDGILAGLDTDRYDCIMSAMTITDERKANYDFSIPYIGNGQALILRKDSDLNVKEPADLKGLLVGYQAETTSDFYIEKEMAAGLSCQVAEYDKVMNAYDDLRLGRVDVVCSDSLVAVDYLRGDSPFKQVWMGTADEYFGVCVKKGNTELQSKITQALKDMIADGTMTQIYLKVFDMDLSSSIAGAQ